ncbi:ABC transporter ATP-binding protein [Pelagibacterium luteolum]|uniref:Oligogalacturonide transport system ATP-binding protein n=1 Tax=Pelagibacterium luteolum TaxID=440168 RepID=A0A1G8ASG1_9HYPH|nr:sn-glycerol-3-phosphate ABC transporter ATP-binding protein UgpC [Pelagibacterium luteolum]SDH23230.1 oligogalacturonide transport system ATP-binding protein [Pelagibacterium luteolum]
MANLSLRSVEKVYGNSFKAVHGIDLEVKDGEFMVLVGPSGCAKSTTLRMIAGLETITGGEIRIGDKVVNNLVPGDRGIAMVFQNYALYPHMKVKNNLSFGLRIKRTPKDEIARGVENVSGILEIEELLERLPKQLSGGQAQRVAVGRALIKQPEVFLFDEPLSNLDAKLRASMRVRITDLHKQLKQASTSSTVVYVTHDQTEAMTMGDRICVMKDGHIMQVADPVTLYNRPENEFVAGFIGSPEMNLIPVALQRNGAPALTIGSQTVTFGNQLASRLSASTGDDLTMGVRPQHMQMVPPETDNAFSGTISHVEFMGHEVNLYVDIEGHKFTVVIPGDHYNPSMLADGAIRLAPRESQLHLFDPKTSQNISLA